jgi:hypothetical protein
MKKKWILGIFFANIFLGSNIAQVTNSSIFGSPLKIPLNISGGFGEIRTNHIHSGIDLRTGGEIGKTVYAAADGFISRIKIEPGGFGKAIYIDHPEGYTTVYAHLDALRDDINEYVKQKQYENQLFPIDLFPQKTDFVIKKGDSIAYSGNSGGSQGPHLHFEIRETVKQSPIQPLMFNFPIIDTEAPSFYSLTIYPMSNTSMVAGSSRKVNFQVIRKEQGFIPKTDNVITCRGPIGVGTEVFDAVDTNANRTGFYMLTMKVDSILVYKNEIASFSFGESRYVNSMIDFAEYMKSRKKITKLYIDPNSKLSVYKANVNRGIIEFTDTLTHNVEVTAFDTYGNKSNLNFKLKFQNNSLAVTGSKDTCYRTFAYNKENVFIKDSLRLIVPLNALYSDLCLKYSERPRKTGYYSKTYQIGESSIPFQYPFEVSIKPTGLSPALMEKALIVRMDDSFPTNVGGTIEKGYIKGKTYIMGSFAVTIDTTPPQISVHKGFTTNYQGIKKTYIAFRITDNLSGIETYKGFIDGKWALFDYDAKRSLLVHLLDTSRFEYNSNTKIRIEVTDSKNNSATLETKYKPVN